MKRIWFATLMALALVAAPAWNPVASAEPRPSGSGGIAGSASEPAPSVGAESWMGALAAVGCGVMIKATVMTGGTAVGTIAGAIACCGFVLLDTLVLAK